MKNIEDIESYLIRTNLSFEEIGEGMWIVQDEFEQVNNLVVIHEPPATVFRLKLMDLPDGDNTELYKTLLELNAAEMMHGAYGIENGSLVMIDALESENLDFNEFQASIDSMMLASRQHYALLSKYFPKKENDGESKITA